MGICTLRILSRLLWLSESPFVRLRKGGDEGMTLTNETGVF